MKKLLLSATVVAGLFAAPTVDSLQKQITELQKQLKELKAKQDQQNDRYYKKVAPIVANNHLYWSYDLRSSFDWIQKETTGGQYMTVAPDMTQPGTFNITGGGSAPAQTYTGRVFSNRVILTGLYKPSENLKATVRIEANKVFGASGINMMTEPFQNFDWVANETPDDGNIRLKEAFFNYFFGDDMMFSAGRRPATNGYPANFREGDNPASPLAHLINMEFDGFSFQIGNGEVSKLSEKFSDWGTWLKFCAGRGYSNTSGKWSFSQPDYTEYNQAKDADFAGFILVPYDDGQYAVWTETVWAFNLQGLILDNPTAPTSATMQTVGNYFGENIIFKADGIGDGINDFLDDTKAFISYAYSQTRPKTRMLGSAEKQSGHSIWIGADMPAGDDGRFGVSYVKGSKYWRSFTYGEDTLAGSIAAVRGHAVDVYYNKEIIPHLTASLRYTYINYDYPGSDGFFGDFGSPDNTSMNYVKTAKDIRAYIRYNF